MDNSRNKCFKFENILDVDKSVNIISSRVICEQNPKLSDNKYIEKICDKDFAKAFKRLFFRLEKEESCGIII